MRAAVLPLTLYTSVAKTGRNILYFLRHSRNKVYVLTSQILSGLRSYRGNANRKGRLGYHAKQKKIVNVFKLRLH